MNAITSLISAKPLYCSFGRCRQSKTSIPCEVRVHKQVSSAYCLLRKTKRDFPCCLSNLTLECCKVLVATNRNCCHLLVKTIYIILEIIKICIQSANLVTNLGIFLLILLCCLDYRAVELRYVDYELHLLIVHHAIVREPNSSISCGLAYLSSSAIDCNILFCHIGYFYTQANLF